MGLGNWLAGIFGDRDEWPEQRPAPPRASLQRHPANCCGRSDFVGYAPTKGYDFDGQHAHPRETGAILSCTHCGEVWGVNEHGLYRPHPECLPGALATVVRSREAARHGTTHKPDPPPRRGGVVSEFRRVGGE